MNNLFKQLYSKIETVVLRSATFQKVATEYYDKKDKLGMAPGPITYKRQPSDMRTKEIKDWQQAVMEATDPDRPRRYLLHYIYQNLLRDDDLQATIENRVLPLQMASFKIIDRKGKIVEDAMRLLERTWFQELRKMAVMSQLQGTLLVDLAQKLNPKTMEIEEIGEVPQCNYIAQAGCIIENPYDNVGTSYRTGGLETYYYQFGKDWDLGMLNVLAMPIYAKKLGFGSWLNYIDLYGIPWMFVITNRMDADRAEELYNMMDDMRAGRFGVLHGQESVEFGKEVSGNTTNAFDPFMERCHKIITRLILGQTGTTNNEAYEGTAKVHEQVEKYRHEADKLLFQYVFNQEIIPRLVKISPVYSILDGCRLEWDDHETMSLKEYVDAIKNLAYTFDFDPEKVAEMTGLPITAVKEVTNQGIQSGGNRKDNGKNGTKEEPDDEPEPPKPGKKKESDKPGASFASEINALYYGEAEAPHALAVEAATLKLSDKIRDRILNRLRSKGFDVEKDIEPDLFAHTFDQLDKALDVFGEPEWGTPDRDFLEALRHSDAVFAAFKAHKQQKELHDLLMDENGKMKSFDRFRKDTEQVILNYNVNWLRTEYDTAVRRARFAADWKRFEKDKDLFPRLKWLPSVSVNKREGHKAFYNRVWDADDPFWATNYPGNLWNCKCGITSTDAPATEGKPPHSHDRPESGLDKNPGITGQMFTDTHPYIKEAGKEAKKAVDKFLKRHTLDTVGDEELTRKITAIENEIRMNKKFETGVAYDKDGNLILDKRGQAYSVSFTREESKLMKNAIFTHNHPRGWAADEKRWAHIGNSFSIDDIAFAVFNDLAEIRAVTPLYTFSMKRPEGGWGKYKDVKSFRTAMNRQNTKIREELMKAVEKESITPEQAGAIHYHLLWKRVAKKQGWNYSKRKTREP